MQEYDQGGGQSRFVSSPLLCPYRTPLIVSLTATLFLPSFTYSKHANRSRFRQGTQPTWGHPSDSSWSSGQPGANSSIQPQYQPQYHEPNAQYQESYYDPNPPGESRTHESGYNVQLPVRPGGGNPNPTLVPSTAYVAPNFAKPTPNSTSTTSRNSLASAGASTYALPSTGTGTTTPPEFVRQSGDTPRPPLTSAGMPSGIDPSQSSHPVII